MNEINNLIYGLKINFTSKAGLDSSIFVSFGDNGLKVKSIRIGKDCITEETINGRVLSGKFDNLNGVCGYRFDYRNGENLININPNVSINDAVSLINRIKKEQDFLMAELILSSILRNDYRVVILNEGNLNIIKTVSAENENAELCSVQENINLSKSMGDESFVIKNQSKVYQIGDKCIIDENEPGDDSEVKSQLSELLDILCKSPKTYKELIEIKKQIQEKTIIHSTNKEKS